jgi:hypothetical protein
MTLESRYRLVVALLEKTKANKLDWQEGPLADSFYTRIGENGVGIRNVKSDFYLVLYDADGNVVEEVSDPEFSGEGYTPAFETMKSLFIFAKRNALGTDKIVSGILSALEEP